MSNDTGLPNDLIGLREATRLLPGLRAGKRIHIATLYRWCRVGRLPSWKIGVGTFVSRSDVLRLAVPVVRPVLVPAICRGEEHRRAVEELARRGLTLT